MKETETARYVKLTGEDLKPKALLIGYDSKYSKKIIERWRQGTNSPPRGNISSALVDQISKIVPLLSASLSGGNLFQVIGTPALMEGIKSGAYTLMQTGGSSLGTVVSTTTGQIAGSLRFAPSTSMAVAIAPVAVWSILNGIAGTLQLNRMNKRLDIMTRKLEQLALRQDADALGRVFQAIRVLDEVIDEYLFNGRFTDLARERLAIAENEVGSILERNKFIVERFAERAEAIQAMRGVQGAEQSSTLLQEEGATIINDMQLLNGLISAQSRVYQAYLFYDLIETPSYADRRMEKIQQRMEEYQTIIRGFPSISSIQKHAKQCVNEMEWFRRKIINRSTVKRTIEIESLQDPFESNNLLSDIVPSYCFWEDENGRHVKIYQP